MLGVGVDVFCVVVDLFCVEVIVRGVEVYGICVEVYGVCGKKHARCVDEHDMYEVCMLVGTLSLDSISCRYVINSHSTIGPRERDIRGFEVRRFSTKKYRNANMYRAYFWSVHCNNLCSGCNTITSYTVRII